MAKKPTVTTLQSGFNSTETLNANFEALRNSFDNTLSLDGSTPNAMEADLDLNGNNLIGAAGLLVNGTDYLADINAAKAAALVAQAAAETAETNAETAETNAESSETAAALSATASQASRLAAETAETNAETAETAASVSAGAAQTAETAAELAETGATTQAGIATTKATEAGASATAAAASAASIVGAETNAANSASAASASQVAAANSAASAANVFDTFDDKYLGSKTSEPTVDNDGDPLGVGALFYNQSSGGMFVWDGSSWVAASSAGGVSLNYFNYTATAGQTTFSGADDNSVVLAYTVDNIVVTLNGIILENGTDYTATTATSIVLTSGASLGDELNILAFKSFTVADMVSATNGGTFGANVTVTGTLAATTLTGDGSGITNLSASALTGALPAISGAALTGLPAGYTNSDVDTHLNSSTATTEQVLSWTGSDYDWVDAASGATGGGSDKVFIENDQSITANYTVVANKNAMTTGPITIDAGVSVTIETGARWVVL